MGVADPLRTEDAELLPRLEALPAAAIGIILLHFAKEEELYLPLLDAGLGSAEAAEMFRAMHESAHPSGSADHEAAHH
jgi:hypothetical protein